ncbi:MAG: hypothetical protein EXR71_12375 [Myxococcales bacterium]|nr:hypothetical protein [Myxococcales bacterium]
MHPWQVIAEGEWPAADGLPWRLALDVDPRQRTVTLGARVPGVGGLELQSGAISRSFFECGARDLSSVATWLRTAPPQSLLARVEAGFSCDVLWSGDPVVVWSEDAWEAGHALYQGAAALLAEPG